MQKKGGDACYAKNNLKVDIWKHVQVYAILFLPEKKNLCVTYKIFHIHTLKETIKDLLKSLLKSFSVL